MRTLQLVVCGAAVVDAASAVLAAVLLPREDALLETTSARPAILDAFRWPMPAWMPPPPVPEDITMTPDLVDLGRHLFYDARLSVDGQTACASCHQQELTHGRKGPRRSSWLIPVHWETDRDPRRAPKQIHAPNADATRHAPPPG